MASNTVKSLVVNVTASATWTQLVEEVANSAYAVPASSHADVRSLIVQNLGANSVTIEFMISATSTPTDLQKAIPPCTLAALNEHGEYDGVIVIVAAKGLWVKCTGTTPNVSVRAAIFEVVP